MDPSIACPILAIGRRGDQYRICIIVGDEGNPQPIIEDCQRWSGLAGFIYPKVVCPILAINGRTDQHLISVIVSDEGNPQLIIER